eukprot:SAG11_NODE_75_length_18024_cov_5.885356_17_plen_87_part_00
MDKLHSPPPKSFARESTPVPRSADFCSSSCRKSASVSRSSASEVLIAEESRQGYIFLADLKTRTEYCDPRIFYVRLVDHRGDVHCA